MSAGNSEVDLDDDSDDDTGYADYYNTCEDVEVEPTDPTEDDPEYFEFKCLTVTEVQSLLKENVDLLSNTLQIKDAFAKVLLYTYNWATVDIIEKFRQDASKLLLKSRIMPFWTQENLDEQENLRLKLRGKEQGHDLWQIRSSGLPPKNILVLSHVGSSESVQCLICLQKFSGYFFKALSCGHHFCGDCWNSHFETQLYQGITTGIECMSQGCSVVVPEDFALSILNKPDMKEKYQQFAFRDYIKSNPILRYCPGPNCNIIVHAKELQSKRVICSVCETTFCFKCGGCYHAPTDCETIKKWLTKCADDSETANYISAHTKDCPKCNICIEKNGGCNHMQCYGCKFDFCWMCLGDWRTHGSEYYECSRYKENPNIANESAHAQAREALKKYLFYFERWENHAKSLRLEEETLRKIKDRIHRKVMANEGTWIDWQYLQDSAALLAKCRYTLQYTYPYAYYMEVGPRKELFEYQQAQLEAEIENLSWKVERAETTDRGELENQMDVAEKRRTTLLKDFLVA